MKFHPLSECLPIMPGHELDELANDIKKHGLRNPITVFEKKIIDGRNRYLACKKAKVKPRFEEFDGEDPVAFVFSNNIPRRHLTPSQRAACAVRLIAAADDWAPAGRPKIGAQAPILDQIANTAGTSKDTVKRAKKVMDEAPEKFEQVQKGEKTVKQAVREIQEEKAADEVMVDALGYPVPKPALPYWNRAQEVKEKLKDIQKLKLWAEELHVRQDPMYSEVSSQWIGIELSNIHTNLKCALPYVVCTDCQGKSPEGCDLCRGRGVISEFRWSHALPPETREMRQQAIEKLRGASHCGCNGPDQ
jgi:ParB-like nuclease family protein